MPTLSKQTRFVTKQEAADSREWLVVDVAGRPLGRAASRVAALLKGKHKPSYQPHTDMGDNVIVLNAELVKLTGTKMDTKTAFSTTGARGGAKYKSYNRLIKDKPEQIIELAVKGMLPTGSFGKRLMKKMHVYRGNEHPHKAQNPKEAKG